MKRNEDWKEEWWDMPEFVQEKVKPFAELKIRFETEEDLKDFAQKIGQKITSKTKSIWHPFKSHWGVQRKIWVDSDES